MLELIGWVTITVFALWVSVLWLLTAWNGLGRYNIGGVPNSIKDKLIVIVLAVAPAGMWWVVSTAAPFTINIK